MKHGAKHKVRYMCNNDRVDERARKKTFQSFGYDEMMRMLSLPRAKLYVDGMAFFKENTEQERPEDQIRKHLKNVLRFRNNESATSRMKALKRVAAASAKICVFVMEMLTRFIFVAGCWAVTG